MGDIIGQFLDAAGNAVPHALNKRVISPSLELLAAIPTVIVASGGINKAPIIAAVLRKKLASVLVSDEATAAEALRLLRVARGPR